MALVHPGKPRAITFAHKAKVQKEMHPALGLLCASAILSAICYTVHIIYNFIF